MGRFHPTAQAVEFPAPRQLSQIKEKFSDVILEYETLIVHREYAPTPFRYFLDAQGGQ